jgi:hypothetical protein
MFGTEIPALFWMVIISILTFFLAMIFYYLAMLLKESQGAMSDARVTIVKTNDVLDESKEVIILTRATMENLQTTTDALSESVDSITKSVKVSVDEINTAVVIPAKQIGSYLQMASGLLQGFLGSPEDQSEELE